MSSFFSLILLKLMNTKRYQGIISKILIPLFVSAVIIFSVLIIAENYLTQRFIDEMIKKKIATTQQEIKSKSSLIMNDLETTSLLITSIFMKGNINKNEKFLLLDLCRRTPWLFRIGFIPVPYNADNDIYIYIDKEKKKHGELKIAPTYNKGNSLFDQNWYKIPLQTKQPYFAEPTKSETLDNDEYTMTYSQPVFNPSSGNIIGIEAVDLSMDWINNFSRAFLHQENINFYFVNKNGAFLIPEDLKTMSPKYKKIIEDTMKNLGQNEAYEKLNKTNFDPLVIYSDSDDLAYITPFFYGQVLLFNFFSRADAIRPFYIETYFKIILLMISLSIMFLILFRIFKVALKPVKEIAEYMKTVAVDNITDKFEIKVNTREAAQLYSAVDIMRKKLGSYLKILKENAAIEAEMDMSKRVYSMFMPDLSVTEGVSIFWKLIPARNVGGDFYNFTRMDNDTFGVCIGDVTGKGFPAALYTVLALTLESTMGKNFPSLKSFVEALNKNISMHNKMNIHITFCTMIINVKTGVVQYISCGHPMPYCLSGGNLIKLPKTRGLPLGIMKDFQYEEKEVCLKQGDKLILYTDGLTDARDTNGSIISESLISEKILSLTESSPEETINSLIGAVSAFSKDAPQYDDICIVCYRQK